MLLFIFGAADVYQVSGVAEPSTSQWLIDPVPDGGFAGHNLEVAMGEAARLIAAVLLQLKVHVVDWATGGCLLSG